MNFHRRSHVEFNTCDQVSVVVYPRLVEMITSGIKIFLRNIARQAASLTLVQTNAQSHPRQIRARIAADKEPT